jgi:hypothetical protein
MRLDLHAKQLTAKEAYLEMNGVPKLDGFTRRLREAEGRAAWLSFLFLAEKTAERELEAAAQGQQLSADFYASMLLLMLVEGEVRFFFLFMCTSLRAQVGNARMAWKRVPSEHKNGTVLKAVHAVTAGLWKGDWEAVNRALGAAVKNELWTALQGQARKAQLALLGRAYSVVAESSAAQVLGTGLSEAGPLLLGAGWRACEGRPDCFAAPAAARAGAAQVDAGQLAQLTNYIVFLERRA